MEEEIMESKELPQKMTLLEFGERLESHFTKYGFTVSEGQLLTTPTGKETKLEVTMVPKSAKNNSPGNKQESLQLDKHKENNSKT